MLEKALEKAPSEFEIQAECYQLLKKHYPYVRGEVKLSFPRPKDYRGHTLRDNSGRKYRAQRGARLDLVVFDEQKKPLFVVEVKRKEGRVNTKQEHYERLTGVPCFTVGSVDECFKIIAS